MADPFQEHIDGMDMRGLRQVTVYPVYLQPRINRRAIIGLVLGLLFGMAVRKVIENIVREWKLRDGHD